MTVTLDRDVDLQTWFAVLSGCTAQHHFELHVCNIHCVGWVRQESSKWNAYGEIHVSALDKMQGYCHDMSCQNHVDHVTFTHVTVGQALKKDKTSQ